MNPALNKSDERLQAALRSLSDSTQAEPSPELGATLLGAFRQHHARRRFRQRLAAVAVLFVASAPALFLLRRNHRPPTNTGNNNVTAVAQPQPVSPPRVAAATTPHRSHITQKAQSSSRRVPANTPTPLQFVALPAYAGSTRTDDARIIRLELSGRALLNMGAPVNPEDEGRQVLADFVVGQDGIPYAVRLVR